VFHRLFSETSGTSMDIEPCEGDACPLRLLAGLGPAGVSVGWYLRFRERHV
jgi:hypothetical protein